MPKDIDLQPMTIAIYAVFRTAEFSVDDEGKMTVTDTEEHLKDEVVKVLLDFEVILTSFIKLYTNAREN